MLATEKPNEKKVAILQSNYIPWKGYFDLIAAVDEFILYDDMQFTKNDWRNRNKVKTPKGLEWISIPVGAGINRRIRDVAIPDNGWQRKHLKTFEINYGRAQYFNEVMHWLTPIYMNKNIKLLSEFNRLLIEKICQQLNIKTKITYSWDYNLPYGKTERLVSLCEQTKANVYVSGFAAQAYLDESLFQEKNIKVEWFGYSGYQEYVQLWGNFEHDVSILDLLFNCGGDSVKYMNVKV